MLIILSFVILLISLNFSLIWIHSWLNESFLKTAVDEFFKLKYILFYNSILPQHKSDIIMWIFFYNVFNFFSIFKLIKVDFSSSKNLNILIKMKSVRN